MQYSRVIGTALMVAIAILSPMAATYAADDSLLTFESANPSQSLSTPGEPLPDGESAAPSPLAPVAAMPPSSLPMPIAAAVVPSRAPQPEQPLPPPPDGMASDFAPVEAGMESVRPVAAPAFALTPGSTSAEPVALTFELPSVVVDAPPSLEASSQGVEVPAVPREEPPGEASPSLEELFANGSDSLVARAVGHAEGTRTATGDRTWAYYGHTDPGNQVWNLGSFSYQHGANSPEAADEQQLQRLKGQAVTLLQQAQALGLTLNLEEQLNAIDLANQSPRAALSRGGYIERLQEARQMGLVGTEAVLWARVRSYIDPDTQRWNAPGLGNTAEGVTRDQRRRLNAIQRAIATYQSHSRQGDGDAIAPLNRSSVPHSSAPSTVDQILNVQGFQFNPFL